MAAWLDLTTRTVDYGGGGQRKHLAQHSSPGLVAQREGELVLLARYVATLQDIGGVSPCTASRTDAVVE